MEQTNNQIIKLALKYCSDSRADTPEEMLFGLAKLSSLSDMAIGYLLKENGIEDTDEFRNGIEELRTAFIENKLDSGLIKTGLEQLLPLIEQEKGDKGKIADKVAAYDEKTPIQKIVQELVSSIDPEELKVFCVGNGPGDVKEYHKKLLSRMEEKADKTDRSVGREEADDATRPEKAGKREKSEPEEEEIEIFSERLKGYLETLEDLVPKMAENGNQELLWRQSLMVAIDDGFGFSSFVRQIEKIFRDNGLAWSKSGKSIVNEMKIVFDIKEREHYFEDLVDEIEKNILEYGKIKDRKKVYSILAIDLESMCNRFNDPNFREFLRYVEQNCDSVFVVFRIPYMDRSVVADISEVIRDIMAVETILVPPLSIPCMVDYMHKRADRFGYTFTRDCDKLLEQAVISEKNDGRFYGFRTLNKIVDTTIYRIIRDQTTKKKPDKKITVRQLKDHLDLISYAADFEQILGNMIGIESIIEQIDKAINQVRVRQQLYDKGQEVESPCIHMMFRGSPGTGKTTIARIVAEKMKSAGILKKGNFFEIKGRDLCGSYVGTTTPKTNKICRDAYGSVLFIDEAYELYRGNGTSGNDYGLEALAALVAEMENHRDDMCVIFAGYTDEMNTMVTGNPGLRDRIPIIIDFPNYTKEQLEEIFFKMMDGKFSYEPKLKKRAHEFFESLGDDVLSSKEFSNARFVRNLFESVWGEAALRFDLDEDEKLVIKECDFNMAAAKTDLKSMIEKKMGRIGFVV